VIYAPIITEVPAAGRLVHPNASAILSIVHSRLP
jgi:hypothetical protein